MKSTYLVNAKSAYAERFQLLVTAMKMNRFQILYWYLFLGSIQHGMLAFQLVYDSLRVF